MADVVNITTAFAIESDYAYFMKLDTQYQQRKSKIETEIARLKSQLENEEKQARSRAKPKVDKLWKG